MPGQDYRIISRPELTPVEIDQLESELYAFNAKRTGFHDGEGLGFLIDRDGARVGAVAGYTWGGICELRQVWVREDCRGQGLGSTLIQAAIFEARRRGCSYIFLSTYDFQAPAFYRRFDFEQIAEIKDKPLGHTEFIFRKSLTQDER